MKVGDKVTFNGQPYTVRWSSEDMTDQERYESHLRTADFMEQYGLSGAFQRAMAEQYRVSDTHQKGGDAKQGSVSDG